MDSLVQWLERCTDFIAAKVGGFDSPTGHPFFSFHKINYTYKDKLGQCKLKFSYFLNEMVEISIEGQSELN